MADLNLAISISRKLPEFQENEKLGKRRQFAGIKNTI